MLLRTLRTLMSFLKTLVAGLRALLRTSAFDRDLDDEVRDFVAHAEQEHRRAGMSAAEAARAARVELGSAAAVKDQVRAGLWEATVETCLRDVRYGARQLRRQPGFALVATLTMALGIGLNVAVFSALNAVVLRPLPIRDAGRAVRIERWFESRSRGNGQYAFSYPEYVYIRDRTDGFDRLVAVSAAVRVPAGARASDSELTFQGQLVSDNFFSGFGVDAAVGRTFTADEARVPGGRPVVVLSDAFWQRHFNRDAGVVGLPLVLDGTPFAIVGVMPASFVGAANPPEVPDFWAPLAMQTRLVPRVDWITQPTVRQLQVVGILGARTSLAAAGARLAVLAASWNDAFPARDKTTALTVERATFFGGTNDPRFTLFVAALMLIVGLILLTACANLANMLLARGTARGREMGVRLALGASRWRIVRQLLTESLLLSLAGAAVALLGSMAATRLLWIQVEEAVQMFGGGRHLAINLSPDVRVFAYTVALAAAAAVACGLWPALEASRDEINSITKTRSVQSTDSSRSRLRGLLIVVQVAVSTTLMVTAGLLTRGVARSTSVNPGFDTTRVYLVSVPGDLQSALWARLPEVPGIRAMALAERVPFTGTWSPRIQIEGSTAPRGRAPQSTLLNVVSSGFFETIGIPIVRGRTFTAEETAIGAPVAVISEKGARAFWPGADPIGRQIRIDHTFGGTFASFTVIGVVADVRSANLSRVDPSFVYLATNGPHPYSVLVRSDGGLPNLKAAIADAFRTVSPAAVRTLNVLRVDQFVQVQRVLPETVAIFATILAVLAMALAAAGIHGVLSFLVSRRTREIGIRMAMGATTSHTVLLVVRQGLRPVAVGVALGLVMSSGLSALLDAVLISPSSPDFLYGLGAFDPLTFGGLTILVIGIALMASASPARRAAAVDPVIALRAE